MIILNLELYIQQTKKWLHTPCNHLAAFAVLGYQYIR